jgi:lipid A 4'-phosphatase
MPLQLSHPLLAYLKLRRTQVILACFVSTSLLLIAFPGVDLRISRLFYDGGFYMAEQGWTRLLHVSVTWFVTGSLATVAAAYAFNRLSGRNFWGVDGKRVVYLLLVLAFGAGLVVNAMFKSEFGRARPRDLVEFGGTSHFTPAYAMSSNCSRNCSFSSGDGAGAFFALAFAAVGRRRRAVKTAAVAFGVLVSAARVAAGAHFLSDVVVSFFVMLIFSDALHFRLFQFDRVPAPALRLPLPRPAQAQAPAAALVPVAVKSSARP